jgi:hypothetical protein
MKRYIIKHDYQSHRGRFTAGQVVELDDEFAAWLNRDSRGVLELVPPSIPAPEPIAPAPEPETRVLETPPRDRMIRRGHKRGER